MSPGAPKGGSYSFTLGPARAALGRAVLDATAMIGRNDGRLRSAGTALGPPEQGARHFCSISDWAFASRVGCMSISSVVFEKCTIDDSHLAGPSSSRMSLKSITWPTASLFWTAG